MVCIYCGGKTKVYNSRSQKRTNRVWRRRACLNCKAIFSSLESPDLERSVSVRYKTGRLEPFNHDKLLFSLYSACGHRKDAANAASALTDTVISHLLPKIQNAILNRDTIAQEASRVIKRFDKPAATAYLAYHPLL